MPVGVFQRPPPVLASSSPPTSALISSLTFSPLPSRRVSATRSCAALHQNNKWLFNSALFVVLFGLMAALSLMTILSVVICLIFHSVPSQFQTTLPIGEYAAVILLMFFGLKALKDAWDLPPASAKTGEKCNQESDEFTEAEELVKEKVSKRVSNPFEVVWKSFSLVFFAEWGDRSMLATIALGAAQSALGVASGAIVGHLLATSIAVLGGAFLANYISEKLVGYIGGGLFLVADIQ